MKWMLLTILVAVCVGRGLAEDFKCYNCFEVQGADGGCGDIFDPLGLSVNEENCTSIEKCINFKAMRSSGVTYTRSCVDASQDLCAGVDDNTCRAKYRRPETDVKAIVCCCTTSLCNNGSFETFVTSAPGNDGSTAAPATPGNDGSPATPGNDGSPVTAAMMSTMMSTLAAVILAMVAPQ